MADAGRDDWILCQVTSNPYGDSRAVHLTRRASTPARCVPTATRGRASCSPPAGSWWSVRSRFSTARPSAPHRRGHQHPEARRHSL